MGWIKRLLKLSVPAVILGGTFLQGFKSGARAHKLEDQKKARKGKRNK